MRLHCVANKKTAAAQQNGFFNDEILPVEITDRKKNVNVVNRDEHPRETTLEALAKLKAPFKKRRWFGDCRKCLWCK